MKVDTRVYMNGMTKTVETKYDLEDKVFYIEDGEIKEGEVTGIYVSMFKGIKSGDDILDIKYGLDRGFEGIEEERLYSSPGKLLLELGKKYNKKK